MKKLFITGLLILLPLAITLFIAQILINILSAPFQGVMESILNHYNQIDGPLGIFSVHQILYWTSKILVVIVLFIGITLVGMLGNMILVRSLFAFGHRLINYIPIVNKIYTAFYEVIGIMFSSEEKAFSQVVFVPYPHSDVYTIGLLSQEQTNGMNQKSIPVFIPCSPNPSIGLMVSYRYDELIFIDMPVDQALKCVVSCGVMFPEFQHKTAATGG